MSLEIKIDIPDGFDHVKLLSLWQTSLLYEKLDIISFISRSHGPSVKIHVPGYIFVGRSYKNISRSASSAQKSFDISILRDDGHIYCQASITGLSNYDKTLCLAVIKSFPSGTFKWDVVYSKDEKHDAEGYIVF